MAIKERLVSRITENNECWEWVSPITKNGYGVLSVENKVQLAHRVSYEAYKGTIPKGLQIDHLCRNRCCINPEHLEAVTAKENTKRGDSGKARGAQMRAKTHCPKGHEYNEQNTSVYVQRGKYKTRRCKKCHALAEKERRQNART